MPRHMSRRTRRRPPRSPGQPAQVPYVPTKPTKAVVAALITVAGLVGIHLTTGTAQAIVMVAQLVVVVYGVWRTYNAPKQSPSGPGVQEFMQ